LDPVRLGCRGLERANGAHRNYRIQRPERATVEDCQLLNRAIRGGGVNVIPGMAGTMSHRGQEVQKVSTPSGSMLFTAPAVRRIDGKTWIFAADLEGTAAWTLSGGKLIERWKNSHGGTSPVITAELLYVYDAKGGLRIYEPSSGNPVAILECGVGHWNSPIVVDGKIALPEGTANEHSTSGVLNIWTLPAKNNEPR